MTTFEIMEEISRIHLELQGAQALGDVLFEKLFVKDKPDRMAYEMEYDRLVLLNRTPTPRDGRANLILREPIGQIMAEL